ncbi:MAG TPA: transglutaminase-like domain-containing protein [Pirellulales bacterium]|nr:transglutaminase-like domain-containing protein [Pirellulales bacterium]
MACALVAISATARAQNKAFNESPPPTDDAQRAAAADAKPVEIQRTKAPPLVLDEALELLDPRTYRLRVGVKIEAPDGAAKDVVAIFPIPIEWPEQRLRVLSEKASSGMKVFETIHKGQVGMIRVTVPMIAKGGSASFERLYEITRYRTEFKLAPDALSLAKQPPGDLRDALTKPAPGIETDHPKISDLARDLGHEPADVSWDLIKRFWQWTRDNVKFQNGDFRGALFAVENGCGDCEEMSALFIGLCRLNGGLARTVWVEGHDYPEFYMLDKKGRGHWIPAQVVGPPWFGEITEYRPIFQKGDRFYDPFQKQYVRYAPQTVRADGGGSPPKLTVIHDIIADSDINGPTYENPAPR